MLRVFNLRVCLAFFLDIFSDADMKYQYRSQVQSQVDMCILQILLALSLSSILMT